MILSGQVSVALLSTGKITTMTGVSKQDAMRIPIDGTNASMPGEVTFKTESISQDQAPAAERQR
jgi:hypothetical protein